MSEPNEVWCWAEFDDSEEWEHAGLTREEAIEYGHEQAEQRDLEGHYGYISKGFRISVEKAAREAVDADALLERMDESDDVYGSFDEPVFELDMPRAEVVTALEDAVAAWALKYVTANGKFTCGAKVEKVPAPAEVTL